MPIWLVIIPFGIVIASLVHSTYAPTYKFVATDTSTGDHLRVVDGSYILYGGHIVDPFSVDPFTLLCLSIKNIHGVITVYSYMHNDMNCKPYHKSIHMNCKPYLYLVSHYHIEHGCSCYFIKDITTLNMVVHAIV